MFFKTLDRLRTKPVTQKKNLAFLVAGGVTALIGFVWLASIPTRFLNNANQPLANQASSFPFSGIVDKAKDQWAAARAALPDTSSVLATSSAETFATSTIAVSSTTVEYSSVVVSSSSAVTSSRVLPAPVPVLIGTTSATSGGAME